MIPARGQDIANWTLKFTGGPHLPDGERRGWPNAPLYFRKTVGNEVHEWRQKGLLELERVVLMDYFGVVRTDDA